jgi:mono/diheme cytochrome c family protein
MATTIASGCSSSDDSSGSSGTAKSEAGLSLAYASQCSRCHGTTATGQGKYPVLPGKLTLATFVGTVRAGRSDMPAFSGSQISDADLTADYNWMTTKR